MSATMAKYNLIMTFLLCIFLLICANKKSKKDDKDKPAWKKKDIRDYTDADMEMLYDEWEDGDDPLEPDELPEYKREPPKVDLSKLDPNNPEDLLKMSKKGRTLMMFVTVSGNPTAKEVEDITTLWQSSLFNAHIDVQRFIIDSNRVIYTLKDGAKAWEVKDYLIQQDRCEEVTIESKSYPGKGAKQEIKERASTKSKKKEEL